MASDSDLEKYPRPAIGVDLALLTVEGTPDTPRLCVLIQTRTDPDGRVLPGQFLRERQRITAAVAQILAEKVGLELPKDRTPRTLQLFDDPERDPRTWALSVANAVSLREDQVGEAAGEWMPISPDGTVESPLLFKHEDLVRVAVEDLRERYEIRKTYRNVAPDPDGFLDGPFTLAQLRKVHEAVLGAPLQRDAFNRRMEGLVEPVLKKDGTPAMYVGIGRPAQLYRKRIKRA